MCKIDGNAFIVEITDVCNFSCPFCFNASQEFSVNASVNSMDKSFMNINDFITIVTLIKNNGYDRIILSGGEPLLHPDIISMLIHLDAHNFRTQLVTNGYLLNEEHICLFLEKDSLTLQIDLDGIDSDTHDAVRYKGSFEKNINTINLMSDKGYKNGVLRMTITKQNYLQVKDVFNYALEKKFTPNFSFVQNIGKASSVWESLALNIDNYEHVIKTLSELIKETPEMSPVMGNLKVINHCPLLNEPPLLKPSVDIMFNVKPCHLVRDPIGNLLEDDFNYIFTEGFSNTLKILKLKQEEYQKQHCNQCSVNFNCNGGCIELMAVSQEKPIECTRISNIIRNSLRCIASSGGKTWTNVV